MDNDLDMFESTYDLGWSWIRDRHCHHEIFSQVEFSVIKSVIYIRIENAHSFRFTHF